MKKTHDGVLILVKLQAEACQIVQRITNVIYAHYAWTLQCCTKVNLMIKSTDNKGHRYLVRHWCKARL